MKLWEGEVGGGRQDSTMGESRSLMGKQEMNRMGERSCSLSKEHVVGGILQGLTLDHDSNESHGRPLCLLDV